MTIARRPKRSALGARNSDPQATPTSAALNKSPSWLPLKWNSALAPGPANDMTNRSKPSSMLRPMHTVMAAI